MEAAEQAAELTVVIFESRAKLRVIGQQMDTLASAKAAEYTKLNGALTAMNQLLGMA